MSQSELGEKASLSQRYVSEIERGTKTPSFDTLVRIAHRAFEVPIADLFCGLEPVVAAELAPLVAAELAPLVAAELAPTVAAELAPIAAAELAPIAAAELAPIAEQGVALADLAAAGLSRSTARR